MKKPKTKTGLLVAVAKDVLNLIDYMNIRDGNGYMFPRRKVFDPASYRKNLDKINEYEGDSRAIQENIPKIAKACEVCARGAMFLAHTHLYDGIDSLYDANYVADEESAKLFGAVGYDIESAFEHPQDPILKKLKPKARLKAIMLQVIRQRGKFKENIPKC